MGVKIAKSALIGLLGSVLFPLSFYFILLLGTLYDHRELTGLMPNASENWYLVSFILWVLMIAPIIVACIGAISLKINSKPGLIKCDYLILPEVAGIIASILGLILFDIFTWIVLPHANWGVVLHNTSIYVKQYIESYYLVSIFWSQCALLGILFYKRIPEMTGMYKLAMKLPKKVLLFVFCLLVISSLMLIYVLVSPASIYVTDVYCDNHGHFNFTIVNSRPSDADLTYKWELDDPKAGKPRGNDLMGSSSVTVHGTSDYNVTLSNLPSYSYDMRWYVLNVDLYDGRTHIYHYNEQKNPGAWDYGTLPPRPIGFVPIRFVFMGLI